MNNHIQCKEVKKRLEENDLQYITIPLQGGFSIICTQRGGRILGPFENENAESIFWLNQAFASPELFRDFLNQDDWNMGGDRVWVAPELPFFVKDRNDFFNSYIVQKEIDPGNYQLRKNRDVVVLEQHVTLEVFQKECKEKRFYLKKVIRAAANPLRALSDCEALHDKVAFCGFQQEIEIRDDSANRDLNLETWVLTQINPCGKLIVPFTGSMEFVDYYEPIEKDRYQIKHNYMELDVTGDVRYKLGFKSAITTGRAGYLGALADGRSYLLIRSYFNDPSSLYCCEPYDKPEQNGCSLYIYNDSGSLGGFAEFENSGITISGATGKQSSVDTINYYIYVGAVDQLNKIAAKLLGANRESQGI